MEDKKPLDSWPQDGSVQFSQYSNRYRDGLDLVLKDVDFDVKPGEKVNTICVIIESDYKTSIFGKQVTLISV